MDEPTKLEVVVAQLVVKMESMAESFKLNMESMAESLKLNMDRLIDKMEHGDREGATLFRLIEERLTDFKENVSPRVTAIEVSLASHKDLVEKRLDEIESSVKVIEGIKRHTMWLWSAVAIGGASIVLAVLGLVLR